MNGHKEPTSDPVLAVADDRPGGAGLSEQGGGVERGRGQGVVPDGKRQTQTRRQPPNEIASAGMGERAVPIR